MSGVEKYTNMVFGAAKGVLFIEVSSFQGALVRQVPPSFCDTYTKDHTRPRVRSRNHSPVKCRSGGERGVQADQTP